MVRRGPSFAYGARFDLTPASVKEKKGRRSPLFWAGLAGTIVFGSVSGAMWGMTIAKKNDYESKVNKIIPNMDEDEWDFTNPEDDEEERKLRKDANNLIGETEKLNKIAVGMTVATGAFAVLTAVGLAVKKNGKESSPVELSALPGGLEVRF